MSYKFYAEIKTSLLNQIIVIAPIVATVLLFIKIWLGYCYYIHIFFSCFANNYSLFK